MGIEHYLNSAEKLGIQTYYAIWAYHQGVAVDEILTSKTPNHEYMKWIIDKHYCFQTNTLHHNRPYSNEEKKAFIEWIKKFPHNNPLEQTPDGAAQ